MAEYIEREATCGDCIHAEICEHMPTLTGYDPTNIAYCRAFRNAADVVEVVRCKDCKHQGKAIRLFAGNTPIDLMTCMEGRMPYCREGDFCSYGERRADNAAD